VIKLGGSLMHSPHLQHWLTAISEHGKGRAVIVPGGGEYADKVRIAQKTQGFDAIEAHRRAIQAMQRMATDYIQLVPALTLAESLTNIKAGLQQNNVPIAMPIDAWLNAKAIPASWDWTSDSLALWLGDKLQIDRLLLVKAVEPDSSKIQAQQAADKGLVDAAFPNLLANTQVSVFLAAQQKFSFLPSWLNEQADNPFQKFI
ncbi:MAG: uridylate kinase, partial [Gammaproteobacteria bacterium]